MKVGDNLALLTDLYEFTMSAGFQRALDREQRGVFDIFYRQVPDNGSFVIAAGLQQALEEIQNMHFAKEDIAYLRSLNIFDEEFLTYLQNFKNTCDIWAVPEGTPIFPREPLMTIRGPLMEAQLYETFLLNILNHQTLIASKARRITAAAAGLPVMEFGARRAQGPSSALFGARAAIIGGAVATSNVLAGKKFDIPVSGTMAHSWIEAFDSEIDAFNAWADIYPDNCSLLVDTYDILNSGVPNAIKTFQRLKGEGHSSFGIRIDSGDITSLSRQARKMLDEAGFPDAKITISNSLNEEIISSLLHQGAQIDALGVGEELITSSSSPVLSGVYKLAAVERDGELIPKIKLSASRGKLTLPGLKQVYRLYHKGTNEAFADLIALKDERLPIVIHAVTADPMAIKQNKLLNNFEVRPLQTEVMNGTKLLTSTPDVFAIQKFSKQQLAELPEATQRRLNPDEFPVYITPQLYALQQAVISQYTENY